MSCITCYMRKGEHLSITDDIKMNFAILRKHSVVKWNIIYPKSLKYYEKVMKQFLNFGKEVWK